MGKIFKFGRWKTIRYIYLPSIMPYIVSALTSGLGAAWKSAIAAEVIARPAGAMGGFVHDARIHLLTADLFAWTITVIMMSMILEKLMVRLLKLMSRLLAGIGRRRHEH
jgi:NitT/TauT family transport system permease protein